MEIDRSLTDKICQYEQTTFNGTVYRVTGKSLDPVAPSLTGGRWAPRSNGEPGFPVLYTSKEREGALAEVASYLSMLSPLPSKPLVIHRLEVTTSKTITLSMTDLQKLDVLPERYGERDYAMTQMIGTAVNYMGIDGLIAQSARWNCKNLTIFMDNHALEERLELISTEEFEWLDWARQNQFLDK